MRPECPSYELISKCGIGSEQFFVFIEIKWFEIWILELKNYLFLVVKFC
jgi:hypothetical protein